MVTKVSNAVVDTITDAVAPRSHRQSRTHDELIDEINAVRRASSASREAYIRRMKMRTRPPLSTREVELAIAQAIKKAESK